LLLILLAAFGCGGGGGGTTPPTGINVVGSVIWIGDGQAPIPAATIQVDQATAQTSTTDGSFTIKAAPTSTSLVILYQNGASTVSYRYTIPPATAGTADMGILYIGPEKVAVTGRVVSAIDGTPVQGATVKFAAREGSTDASGMYRIEEVAYSNDSGTAFFDLEGQVTRKGFLPQSFRAIDPASAGVVTIADVLLVPESGNDPPPPPYNITGKVSPTNSAAGTVVTLKQGGTPIRRFTVGGDGTYGFWVLPGTYTMSYQNPTNNLSAPDETATLSTQNQVVNKDVTLR
jgi:hypothetical protein